MSPNGIVRVKNRKRIRKILYGKEIREGDLFNYRSEKLSYRSGRFNGFPTGHNPYKETTDPERNKLLLETNGVIREFYPDILRIATRKRREEIAIP